MDFPQRMIFILYFHLACGELLKLSSFYCQTSNIEKQICGGYKLAAPHLATVTSNCRSVGGITEYKAPRRCHTCQPSVIESLQLYSAHKKHGNCAVSCGQTKSIQHNDCNQSGDLVSSVTPGADVTIIMTSSWRDSHRSRYCYTALCAHHWCHTQQVSSHQSEEHAGSSNYVCMMECGACVMLSWNVRCFRWWEN